MFLGKDDFTTARECPAKLYYKKMGYPGTSDGNSYLAFLADGGFMVKKMAQLLYRDGRWMGRGRSPDAGFQWVQKAIQEGDCTLFDATVTYGNLLVHADILRRQGQELHLIEVKSSSISMADGAPSFRKPDGKIVSEWRPALEEIALQCVVLRRALPNYTVRAFLCLVDKSRTATENSIFDKFILEENNEQWASASRETEADGQAITWTEETIEDLPEKEDPLYGPVAGTVLTRDAPQCQEPQYGCQVCYTGNPERLQDEHVLAILEVSAEVIALEADMAEAADQFAQTLLQEPPLRIPPQIGKKCKSCEFRIPWMEGQRNGFRECWGPLADCEPHILDLYRVDLLGGGGDRDGVAELAGQGVAGLLEVPEDMLVGRVSTRQRMQIEHSRLDTEFCSPALIPILHGHPGPLHFIDFETSRVALPYHAGMHPYELSAVQWSCHTLLDANGPLHHQDWLNTQDAFPNWEFARTLRDQIGDSGTVYIWSPYERTVLKTIRQQMDQYGLEEPDLALWLDEMSDPENPRVVDLCALARAYYFHPVMKGSLSIKNVLPAVWRANPGLRRHPWFIAYDQTDAEGRLLNPYDTLPPIVVRGKQEVVSEGTAAMRVYQEMIFGSERGDADVQESRRRLLLQYCRLDTLAMVIIWKHWSESGENHEPFVLGRHWGYEENAEQNLLPADPLDNTLPDLRLPVPEQAPQGPAESGLPGYEENRQPIPEDQESFRALSSHPSFKENIHMVFSPIEAEFLSRIQEITRVSTGGTRFSMPPEEIERWVDAPISHEAILHYLSLRWERCPCILIRVVQAYILRRKDLALIAMLMDRLGENRLFGTVLECHEVALYLTDSQLERLLHLSRHDPNQDVRELAFRILFMRFHSRVLEDKILDQLWDDPEYRARVSRSEVCSVRPYDLLSPATALLLQENLSPRTFRFIQRQLTDLLEAAAEQAFRHWRQIDSTPDVDDLSAHLAFDALMRIVPFCQGVIPLFAGALENGSPESQRRILRYIRGVAEGRNWVSELCVEEETSRVIHQRVVQRLEEMLGAAPPESPLYLEVMNAMALVKRYGKIADGIRASWQTDSSEEPSSP